MKNIKCIKCDGDDVGYYDHVKEERHFGGWNNNIDYKEIYTKYICRSKNCNFEWEGKKLYPSLSEKKFGKKDALACLAAFAFFAFLIIFVIFAFLLNC